MLSRHDHLIVRGLTGTERAVVRVLIATDLRLYRESLAELLGRLGLCIVSCVGEAGLALARLQDDEPDVFLLDMAMPGGFELAAALNQTHPSLRIVALAVLPSERVVLSCAEAGVVGYALRDASAEDLVAVITSAAQGELRCPPVVAGILRQHLSGSAQADQRRTAGSSLTRREREIVPLLDQGLDNKAIARTLGIEIATVKNHVHNILEKLQVHRRGEAAAKVGGRVA
jgi:two-component system, NarL family, nitrate/nitrite response regulator NarL